MQKPPAPTDKALSFLHEFEDMKFKGSGFVQQWLGATDDARPLLSAEAKTKVRQLQFGALEIP